MLDKLEKQPQPNRYCGVCLGYGSISIKNQRIDNLVKVAEIQCRRCGGTGWMYEDK